MDPFVPATGYNLGVLLVLVVPGIVYGVVRASLTGTLTRDRDWSSRVLHALLVSIAFDASYLLAFGGVAVEVVTDGRQAIVDRPRQLAVGGLVLGIVVPAACAYLFHGRPRWQDVRVAGRLPLKVPLPRTGYRSAPTAWDHVAGRLTGRWVRIRLADGKWVAGWFGSKSFVSTYPEPRDIFIEDQHYVGPDGTIGSQVTSTAGVWVSLKEGDVVEWIDP